MSITLDGFTFELSDFTGTDGLGHTETQAAATGAVSGLSYPAEPLFPDRIMRAMLNQMAIDNATTSSTSNDVTTGSQTFTLDASILNVGEFVIASQTSNVANYIYGQVTAVSGSDATINGIAVGGSGSGVTDWSIVGGAGTQGAAGTGLPANVASKHGVLTVQNDTDDGYKHLAQGNNGEVLRSNGADALPTWEQPQESIIVACSGEDADLEVATGVITFRMPYAFTLTGVRASVKTAPTGANLIVDINDDGSTIMTTDKLSIDAGEKTSTTAATAAALTTTALADDSEITIDVDQIGSTVAGQGLKVALIGYRTP